MGSKTSKRIDRLWCRVFGHHFVDGLRYHNASTSGCSKMCHRCGFYEVILDDPHQASSPLSSVLPSPADAK